MVCPHPQTLYFRFNFMQKDFYIIPVIMNTISLCQVSLGKALLIKYVKISFQMFIVVFNDIKVLWHQGSLSI